jgi:acid phosphatase
MKSRNQIYIFSFFIVLYCGYSKTDESQIDNSFQEQSMLAVLYTQTSAEFAANNIQVYNNAINAIDKALEDTTWTAALEQKGDFASKRPAIIIDVDETVLDNTAFQARTILEGFSYPEGWIEWGLEGSAEAVAGVSKFLTYADQKGVKIFYVTNRVSELEESTKKNIKNLKLPFDEDTDVLLMKGENGWTSDKVARRLLVSSEYRIILLVGDQLTDFISSKEATLEDASRKALASKYQNMWGSKWFMITNPMYGRWEYSLYDNKDPGSEENKIQLRKESLRIE